MQKKTSNDLTYLLLFLLIAASFVFVGGVSLPGFVSQTQNIHPIFGVPVQTGNSSSHQNLQLDQLRFVTLTPTPSTPFTTPTSTPPSSNGSVCPTDGPKTPNCTCETHPYIQDLYYYCTFPSNSSTDNKTNALNCQSSGGMYTELTGSKLTYWNHPGNFVCAYTPQSTNYAAHQNAPNCYAYCVAKPVIYLYPLVPTRVRVSLNIPGIITTSIPTYPSTGWSVLAHPGGEITYQERNYHELFYESEVNKVNAPNNGVIIANTKLKTKLLQYTYQLGLLPNEQQEFLQYWMPKLEALHAPYIEFSVLTPKEKNRIDHVSISPKPDTFIEFLAYFKPLWRKKDIKPLDLPKTPPKRIGFTAVEWGGTIDPY